MFENLFSNAGGKIKVLAKVFFVLGIIASVIYGIVVMTLGGIHVLYGFLIAIIGSISSWISSILMFGFGTIVENTDKISTRTSDIRHYTFEMVKTEKDELKKEEEEKKSVAEKNKEHINFKCPSCKTTLSYSVSYLEKQSKVVCPMCEHEIDVSKK